MFFLFLDFIRYLLIVRRFLARIYDKLSVAMRAGHVDFALMAREAKHFFTALTLNELMSFALLEFIVLKFEKALNTVFKLKPLCIFRSASLDIF